MNKVICAFPGLGKTFLSHVNPHFIDLDFIQYKTMSREDALSKYAQNILAYPSRTVLINEPFVIPHLKDRVVTVVIPQSKADILARIRKRGDVEFATHLDSNYEKWIQEWSACADRGHCRLIRTSGYLLDIMYMCL